MKYRFKRLGQQSYEARFSKGEKKEFEFFFASDVHFDSVKCKRKLFFQHMDEAKERGAFIVFPGDFFDLMGGRFDPRRVKGDIRPEYTKANYIDSIIEDAADKLAPYVDNILLFSDGNHETAIRKNLETDPLERLTTILKDRYKCKAMHAGYQLFLKLVFEASEGGNIKKHLLFIHHGKFGGIVTKGVLGVDRHSLAAPQANSIITGHTHNQWLVPITRLWVDKNGKVDPNNVQYHVKLGTYKQEFETGSGWAVERLVRPANLGGAFLRIRTGRQLSVKWSLAM